MNVETAKEMLVDEIKNASYANGDPFGNAGSYQKVLEFLYQSAMNSISISETQEDILALYKEHQTEEEHTVFKDRITVLVTALSDLKNQGKLK